MQVAVAPVLQGLIQLVVELAVEPAIAVTPPDFIPPIYVVPHVTTKLGGVVVV